MEVSLSPLDDGGMVGTLRDITLRKQAEDEPSKLSLVANLSQNLVLITDNKGFVEWANLAFLKRTGYSLEEIIGSQYSALLKMPDADITFSTNLQKYLRGEQTFKKDLRSYTRNGESYWASTQITPVMGSDGSCNSHIIVQTETTQFHEAAEILEQARDHAMLLNEAKTQFLATISHEMRTPLNVILGSAELARDPALGREQMVAYLRRIDEQADLLLRLINDMLDTSKMESGQFDFELVPVSLSSCISQTVAPLGEKAAAKGLGFDLMLDDRLPTKVLADSVRLGQVVTNLVQNAIKFTDRGRIQVHVEPLRRKVKSGTWFEIRVSDTGCGIPAEALERIFDRFEQADNSITRRKGGVGLGLNIVKTLAERLGGKVSVQSKLGAGSVFRVVLPLEIIDESKTLHAIENEPPLEPVAENSQSSLDNGLRILVAEDSDPNYTIVSIFLAKAGYSVLRAQNGLAAVELACDVDLILMDVEMPEMDGLEATRRIRAAERDNLRRPVPILALSAHGVAGYRNACFAAGCSGFLTKPIRPQALYAALNDALRSAKGMEPGDMPGPC